MAEDKRLRHPSGGGYARGEETRKRIIEASIAVFGERGYDAATTREIAQRAEVNPPALQYYFENKEGLYRACVDYMACTSSARFGPIIDKINAALDAGAQGEEAIALFCLLQDTIIDHLLGSGDMRSRHLFMAREETGHAPDVGIDTLRRQVGEQLNGCGTAILARLSGESAQSDMLKLKTLMLFGQVLVFHVARSKALATLGWTDFDAKKVLQLKTAMREQTQAVLRASVR